MRKVFTIEASDLDKDDGAALVYSEDSTHFPLEPMALLSWDEYERLQAVAEAVRQGLDCYTPQVVLDAIRALDGEPSREEVEKTMTEAFEAGKKSKVVMLKGEPCPTCGGSGDAADKFAGVRMNRNIVNCPDCHGTGRRP